MSSISRKRKTKVLQLLHHIENFKIDDPGPDNIVLLESENFYEKKLRYHSKVEWYQRFQKYWKELPDSNPLSKKYIRRENIQCVKSLKVRSFSCSIGSSPLRQAH